MGDPLWIAYVRAGIDHEVARVAPAPPDWRSRAESDDSFIVSAPTPEAAHKVASRILARARQRAQLGALATLGREGYAKCLDDLLSFVQAQRAANVTPAADFANLPAQGRWFGREDALADIERWAQSMRSTASATPETCPLQDQHDKGPAHRCPGCGRMIL